MKDKLKKMVLEHSIISFDIFDTLLFRNVYEPIDIFKLVGKELNIDDFCSIRMEAEASSRVNVTAGECNYDEIYDEVSKKIGNELSDKAKKIELDLELDFIDVNPFMKEIFDYAVDNKKKVYLISDMYLSSEFISKMLKKAGYNKVPLYVSCEHRAGKGTWKLFSIVCDENNLDKSSWLHIGDNKFGDYQKPIEFGIDAYNYKNIREYDKSIIPNSIEESIITSIQNNFLYNGNDVDYWTRFGALYISPIYFGFTFWLYKLSKDLDNLFFIARDGYIIEKIYRLFPETSMYINYIYCSRKSLYIPSLLEQSDDYMIHMLTMKNDVVKCDRTLGEMFKNAQLSCDDKYIEIIKQFGFDSFSDIITDNNYDRCKKLIAYLVNDIKNNLKEQYDLAIKYLNQEGMDKFDRINVVDIGWAGSIQYAIKNLLDKDTLGYYFGTVFSGDKEDLFSSTFGWYFDLDNNASDKESVLSNVMMYELIFSAPHGTTVKYKNGKKIEPVLADEDNIKIVSKFQDSALEIIKKYLKYYKYFNSIDKYFCLERYKRFIDLKNYEDMTMFSKLSNDFVLGSDTRYSYVKTFKKEDLNDFKKFNALRNKSVWRGTYFISDISNENELEQIINKVNKYDKLKLSVKGIGRKIVPFKVRKKLLDLYRK